MPRLLIGIDWLDNLRLRPMPAEEIRDPTDAADDSTKKRPRASRSPRPKGASPHRAVEMRRIHLEGETLTLLGALLASPWPPHYLYIHSCSYT